MCGIFGIFRLNSALSLDESLWCSSAERKLRHRGPDDHDVVSLASNRCLLGHTRLSIIDLEGGAQPLWNEDRTISVICNGEIYNYLELREKLIARGHHFRTQSDCEVLVHLYEDRGEGSLEELEGMFAFALFDERNHRLFIARDRFGEKPLYWTELAGTAGIAFASELKALEDLPGLNREYDLAALAQFMALRYIPAPRTLYRHVHKLRAGESLICDGNGVRTRKYFQLDFAEKQSGAAPSRTEAVEQLQQKVREAVRLRLRSDVPVGAFLSGGIDSTAIVCAIRELAPGARLHTFCASFEGAYFDEAPFAKTVAQHVESDHVEVRFHEHEMLSVLEDVVAHFDEPFADPSMLPTFTVCRAARQQCKVMLSGDGGDEFFAGYRELSQYYRWRPLRQVPGVPQLSRSIRAVRKNGRGSGLLAFLGESEDSSQISRAEFVLASFARDVHDEVRLGLQELHESGNQPGLSSLRSKMASTAQSYLPEQILVKVDRTSMMASLESRAPFLDLPLIRFALVLPMSFHFERGLGKALLRRALPAWVPDRIRWRDKQGFTPPLSSWMRTVLRQKMQEALNPETEPSFLNLSGARTLFEQHLAGADHSDMLFRWLVLLRRLGASSSVSATTARRACS